ncbi:MAG: sugar phosphate isomerase/epimerase [Candidatus Bipolaricaulota bacterium]|nr:sugar phosphate isomerase/epimerase [Candidatus Bipolaricaulota bacterium]
MDRARLGLATFHVPGRDLWAWVELAQELGLGGVELRADPGIAHPDELSPADRRRLRALGENGLRLSLHMPIHGVNLTWPVRAVAAASLRELVRSLDLAAEIGAEVMVIHPGRLPAEYVPFPEWHARSWDLLRFALGVLLPRAARLGVRLALENLGNGRDRGLVQTAEEHAAVLAEFPELWACFDLGHLHTLGGAPREHIARIAGRLLHVHLHDNRGDWDAHLPLDEGTAPWREALRALADHGFRGRIVLELPDPDGLRRSLALLDPL